jgi:hypothetical protein
MSTEIPPSPPEAGAVATRVQILATEHWSLLATRSLTYNESLTRVNIFLAILSSAVITLALIAQADHFGRTFITIAIPMLLIVFYAGITTIARVTALNRDDYRWVIGMNRLRHAYLELHPDLDRYFVTGQYDDLYGALQTLGIDIDDAAARRSLASVLHLPQTLPGMLTVIVAAVAGAITALVALALGVPSLGIAAAAAAGFVVVLLVAAARGRRSFKRPSPSLAPRFPTPGK